MDDPDLLVEALLVDGQGIAEAARLGQGLEGEAPVRETVTGDLLEVAVGREPGRHRESGQRRHPFQLEAAHLGHPQRVGEGFGVLREGEGHLRGALQVELRGVEAEALGVFELLARPDAEQHVVGVGVVLQQVVGVVRGHEGQARALPHARERAVHPPLLLEPVLHHLEEEPALVEDLAELAHHPQRLGLVAVAQRHPELAGEAAGEADDPPVVLLQELLVDARTVVEALGVPRGHELDEVVVALGAGGEQGQVVVGVGDPGGALVEPAPRGHVDLAAEDGRNTPVAAGVVERHRPEHVAVIGDGQRLHAEPRGLVHEGVDLAGPVEEAVLGVQVEVDELGVIPIRSWKAACARRRRPRG